MNAWPFVAAAYALTLGTTAIVGMLAWRAMRDAEK